MMPLELNPSGVLSVSVHDTTLDTIELLFGQARRSTRRVTLFAKLKEYVTELRSAEIRGSRRGRTGRAGPHGAIHLSSAVVTDF